jgi:lysophospholipid acyltransferase (LPLAT)-like uncharacterized protein
MRVVFLTSRVEDHGLGKLRDILDRYGGAVGLLWHEEIPIAVYGYPRLGFRPSTLASYSDAGEVIARVLKRLGYDVFRGGSSYRESRKNGGVLNEMIEHMRTGKRVFYGLTVDGSQGPAYRIKSGGVVIARECGKPVVLLRTWHKRCLRLGGWDRMAIPLPFNVITFFVRGPYFVPESADTAEGLGHFVEKLQDDLIDLTVQSYDRFLQPRPEKLRDRSSPSPDA